MATAVIFATTARAGVIDEALAHRPIDRADGTWIAWGGQTRFHFNPDELSRLGVRIERAEGASSRIEGRVGARYEVDAFPARDGGGLEINHEGRSISGVGGGSLQHAGGPVLSYSGGTIDLRGFALRASADTRIGLDVVDANGTVWLTADHAHYGFERDAPDVFSMREMNLRLSRRFAAAIGRPDLAGDPIGGLEFRAHSQHAEPNAYEGGVCSAPWPDPPSAPADIGLIYGNFTGFGDSIYIKRCNGCTPTSTTGDLVINQDASLKNVGTTGIAWYGKFSGTFPPYGNDQHPYLVWNLYRVDADGRIRQIGVSGVKHAFYTVNYNCGCGGGNVLYPTCEDVYSSYNNDSSTAVGPRSEIIPFTGQWGRCGSVYDADCDGVQDADGGAQDLYQFRMNVSESDLLPPLSTGAHYYYEYWYVARDDPAIYNAMGWREVSFRKSGADWSADLVGVAQPDADFHVGPALDAWIDPDAPPANALNVELSTPLGRARVAVKASDLGSGLWRYEYAVENFDYAHAQIDAAHPDEPNLKVDSSHGFARFSVPLAPGVTASALRFDDIDADAGNDWAASASGDAVTWSAPPGNSLDWGTLYHFEFVANAAPAVGSVGLVGIATATEPEQTYTLAVLVPRGGADATFDNGFD